MSAAPVTRERALELLGEALHRFQVRRALQELRRSGATIRISRTWLLYGSAWQVMISRSSSDVTVVVRPNQLDAIANAIGAVTS